MKDTRIHYPKEPISFSLLSGVWRTGSTMCGKRRTVNLITDEVMPLTCGECIGNALIYWNEQETTAESLLEYADSGALIGTSVEGEAGELIPKLRIALGQATAIITLLKIKARQ